MLRLSTKINLVGKSKAKPMSGKPQRADARHNFAHLVRVAADVIERDGTEASLRDIARRAGVGLGTLYRHFPTREALLAALLQSRFDKLTSRASELEKQSDPLAALTVWVNELAACAASYRGLSSTLLATMADESSPLHASCKAMRVAGGRLLTSAQRAGRVRTDVRADDLFTLVGAVAGAADHVSTSRTEHMLAIIIDGITRVRTENPKKRR